MFSIPNYMAQLNSFNGLLRNNKYTVQIDPPQALGSVTSSAQWEFLADSSSIPASALATADVRRYGYGAVEKKPYAPLFTDVNMTFQMDGQSILYEWFYKWINMIDNYRWTTDESSGGGITSETGILPNQHPYELAYKDDYATTVKMIVFDATATKQLQINLRDAYPVFLGDLPLNWAATDPYIKIPVTFTFMDWYMQYPKVGTGVGGDSTTGAAPPATALV